MSYFFYIFQISSNKVDLNAKLPHEGDEGSREARNEGKLESVDLDRRKSDRGGREMCGSSSVSHTAMKVTIHH